MASENNNNNGNMDVSDNTSNGLTNLEALGIDMEIHTEEVPTPTSEQLPGSSSEQESATIPASESEQTTVRQPNEIFRAMMDFGIDFDLANEHRMNCYVGESIFLAFDQDGKKITDPEALSFISKDSCDEAARKALPLCYLQTEPFTTESFLAKRDQLEKFASRLKNIRLTGHLFSLPWSMEMNALWSRFSSLEKLALDNSGITTVPNVVFRLPKLKSLSLSGNPITTLDWTEDDVKGSNLESISLERTKIQKLPKTLVWPSKLRYADFDHVKTLTDIECSFPESLDRLILRGTRISDAPKGIRYIKGMMLDKNPCLTVLHLESASCLEKLSVRQCPNLTNIEFSGEDLSECFDGIIADECHFSQIPSGLQNFVHTVEFMNFGDNQITELPMWLKDAKKLEVLRVCNNQLTNFPEEIVTGLSKLKAIDLSNNPKLNSLPVMAMCEHMKRMSECDIKGTAVPYDAGKVLEEHCQKQRGGGLFQLLKKMQGDCEATGDGGDENPNDGGGETVECSIC